MLSVASDIDQVWANAMTYNQDASYIYAIAAELKSYADKKMAPLVAAARDAGETPQELTFEMKRQLNENAALLSSKDLYGMVGIVEDTCKRAIDQSNPQEVEIDLDSLDLTTFLKVDKYVQDCISRARAQAEEAVSPSPRCRPSRLPTATAQAARGRRMVPGLRCHCHRSVASRGDDALTFPTRPSRATPVRSRRTRMHLLTEPS